MTMQLYGHQIKDAEITQAHHARFGGHVAHVHYSNLRGNKLDTPPGSETAGDTFIVGSTPSGDWSGFSTGNIVQALVDSPASSADWQLLAASMTTGRKMIIGASGLSGTYSGHANALAEKTGSGIDDYTFTAMGASYDGQQAVQVGNSIDIFANVTHLWNDTASAWAAISDIVEIAAADNALEYDNGKISHRTQLGHAWSNRYCRGVVMGTVTTEPSAVGMVGYTFLFTGGSQQTWDGVTVVDPGQFVYCLSTQAGMKWQVIGTRINGETLVVPPAGAVGDFVGHTNEVGMWAGNATTGTWTFVASHRGDEYFASLPETGSPKWTGVTFGYNGTSWIMLAMDPVQTDDITDGCISFSDTYMSYAVTVQANGGVQKTSGGLQVGPTAMNAISASNPVADKDYVDSVIEGFSWQKPADTKNAIGTADSAPGGASAGDSYIVGTTWGGFSTGDLVEYNGATWNVVVAGAAGEPATGTRVIVDASPTGSDIFDGHANDIAEYDGASWVFSDPDDGWAILIRGETSVNENTQWVFDAASAEWVQVGAQSVYTAGFGLNLSGGQFSVDWLTASATKTSGTTWDTGLGSTIDIDKAILFRNGILQKKVASGPGAGEYSWSAGTATFGTTFDAGGEYCYVAAPGV